MVLAEVTACDKFFMRGKIIDRGPLRSLVEEHEAAEQIDLSYNPAAESKPLVNGGVTATAVQTKPAANIYVCCD